MSDPVDPQPAPGPSFGALGVQFPGVTPVASQGAPLLPSEPVRVDIPASAVQDERGVWVKAGDKFYTVPRENLPRFAQATPGLAFATPDEVQARLEVKRQEAAPGAQLKTALEHFGTGIVDAISAPGRGLAALGSAAAGYVGATDTERALQDFARDAGGEALARDAAYLSGGKRGVESENEFVRAYVAREQAFPMTAGVSRMAGLVVPAVAMGFAGGAATAGAEGAASTSTSLMSRLATTILSPSGIAQTAASGLVQGGVGGAATPFETMSDTPISREAILASGAMGAILGGVIGAGVGTVSKYGPGALGRIFGRGGATGESAEAEVRASLPEAIQQLAESPHENARALYRTIVDKGEIAGKGVNEIADRIESAMAKAGPNPELRAAAAREAVETEVAGLKGGHEISPSQWRDARLTPDEMVRNRDVLQQGARDEITRHLSAVLDESKQVMEHLRNFEVKTPLVEKNLASLTETQQTSAIGKALSFVRERRSALDELAGQELNAARKTGLMGADYARDGMRDMQAFHAAYEGATPEQVADIAAGRAPPMGSRTGQPLPPVTVVAEPSGSSYRIILKDGRHRMLAAAEAGADEVSAKMRILDKAGNIAREWTGTLPIAAQQTEALPVGRVAKSLAFSFEQTEKAIAESSSAAEAYVAIDKLRRQTDKWLSPLTNQVRSPDAIQAYEGKQLLQFAEGSYEKSRLFLADADTWGKQGLLQQKVNQAWADDIAAEGRVTKLGAFVSRDISDRYGQYAFRVDPDKIDRYLAGLGEKTLPDADLQRMVQTKAALMREVGGAYGIPKEMVSRAAKSADELAKSIEQANRIMTTSGGLETHVANLLQSRVAKIAGHAAGSIAGGAIGGVPGALVGHSVGAALEEFAATKIPEVISVVTKNKLGFGKIPEIYQKALNRNVLGSVPAAARGVVSIAETAGKAAQLDAYNKRTDVLAKLSSSPDAMMAATSPALARFGTVQPTLPASVAMLGAQQLARLQQAWPGQTELRAHGKPQTNISSDQLRLANAMWEATTKPLSVFDDFKSGKLDPDKARFAWVQYPELKRLFQAAALDTLQKMPADREPPHNAMAQLDQLLEMGGALDPSQSPQALALSLHMGGVLRNEAAQSQPQPRPINTKQHETKVNQMMGV